VSSIETAAEKYIEDYMGLKNALSAVVLQKYSVNLGKNFSEYPSKINRLNQQNTVCGITTDLALNVKDGQKKQFYSDELTDISIDSIGRFEFWFLDRTETFAAPNLSSVEYVGSEELADGVFFKRTKNMTSVNIPNAVFSSALMNNGNGISAVVKDVDSFIQNSVVNQLYSLERVGFSEENAVAIKPKETVEQ